MKLIYIAFLFIGCSVSKDCPIGVCYTDTPLHCKVYREWTVVEWCDSLDTRHYYQIVEKGTEPVPPKKILRKL